MRNLLILFISIFCSFTAYSYEVNNEGFEQCIDEPGEVSCLDGAGTEIAPGWYIYDAGACYYANDIRISHDSNYVEYGNYGLVLDDDGLFTSLGVQGEEITVSPGEILEVGCYVNATDIVSTWYYSLGIRYYNSGTYVSSAYVSSSSTHTFISKKTVVPSGVNTARIMLKTSGLYSGAAGFDFIVLWRYAANGFFEVDDNSDNIPDYWSDDPWGTSLCNSSDTSISNPNDTLSMERIDTSGTCSYFSQPIIIDPSEYSYYNLTLIIDKNGYFDGDCLAGLRVFEDDCETPANGTGTYIYPSAGTEGYYHGTNINFTDPDAACVFIEVIQNNNAEYGDKCYFDEVSFEPVSVTDSASEEREDCGTGEYDKCGTDGCAIRCDHACGTGLECCDMDGTGTEEDCTNADYGYCCEPITPQQGCYEVRRVGLYWDGCNGYYECTAGGGDFGFYYSSASGSCDWEDDCNSECGPYECVMQQQRFCINHMPYGSPFCGCEPTNNCILIPWP